MGGLTFDGKGRHFIQKYEDKRNDSRSYFCELIDLLVKLAAFGPGHGVVHGCPTLGSGVNDDSQRRPRRHDRVCPERVLNAQGFLLLRGVAVQSDFADETVEKMAMYSFYIKEMFDLVI